MQHTEQCHTQGDAFTTACFVFRDLFVCLQLLEFASIIHKVIIGAGYPSSHWLNGCLLKARLQLSFGGARAAQAKRKSSFLHHTYTLSLILRVLA